MSYEPKPVECLFLWRLAAAGGGDWKKAIKPDLDAVTRGRLVDARLIEQQKRKPEGSNRAVLHLSLTDGGWAWLADHMDAELPKRANANETLRVLIGQLKRFLDARDLSLAELFTVPLTPTPAQAPRPEPPPIPPSPEANGEALSVLIETAYHRLSGGRKNVRIHLADLREELPNVSRERLDDALLEMATHGAVTLYTLQNPVEIQPRDHAAALRTASGHERHILYLGEPS